jgi:SAM-dependent methyltransferase
LACPHCLSTLACERNALVCADCRRRFPVVEGIPLFAPTNKFYDAYADNGFALYKESPAGLKGVILRFLPFWSWREWRFWRTVIAPCGRLLDIGCGRGRELFAERSREAIGYDSSLNFARECATHYKGTVVGALPRLPFRSAAFDAVVSSHVIGHVSADQKDELIRETARVLRRGGITAHIIETDSAHRAVVAAKHKPEAYRQRFIEQHGHIGLEPAAAAIQRFASHGFRLRRRMLVDAIVPSVLSVRTFFNHPDFDDLPGLRWARCFERWTTDNRVTTAAYEVGMGFFHRTLEQWCGNPANAQFILVVFDKP